MIKFFKSKPVQNWMLVLAGTMLLNMSFFWAEVSALKLNKDKALLENISKFMAGASEEENDSSGSEKAGDSTKLDFDIDILLEDSSNEPLLATALFLTVHHSMPEDRNNAPFNPPPEV